MFITFANFTSAEGGFPVFIFEKHELNIEFFSSIGSIH